MVEDQTHQGCSRRKARENILPSFQGNHRRRTARRWQSRLQSPNFFGSRDGLVHISQLAPRKVAKVTDVVKEGDKVWVKLLGFDERGKVRLSMKIVDQTTGQEIPKEEGEKPTE
jgi:polyribonucleotide nucleotidyltransferase